MFVRYPLSPASRRARASAALSRLRAPLLVLTNRGVRAAFAVRPHAAAGTAKAAADGWALAEELTAAGGNVPAALAAWERRQLVLGKNLLARCRAIGDSSQFLGTFRPGDPRLTFGLYRPGD